MLVESKRKPFSTLKAEVGRSTRDFTSELMHSSFQLGVMRSPISRPRRRTFLLQNFFSESEYKYSLLYNSVSASVAPVIARSPYSIESVIVLEDTSLSSAMVLHITARFYQFPNGSLISILKHIRYTAGM